MEKLRLFKVYLVYGKRIVLQLYYAKDIGHVYELMEWSYEDKPKPIIEEIELDEPGCKMLHHISDSIMVTQTGDKN